MYKLINFVMQCINLIFTEDSRMFSLSVQREGPRADQHVRGTKRGEH